MNLQIYMFKKNFDVQKAERFFKERRIRYQLVDMKKQPPGLRELQAVKAGVGLRAMIDTQNKDYSGHYLSRLMGEGPILEALCANPQFLKTPIVRNGRAATVGYAPEVWESWIQADQKG